MPKKEDVPLYKDDANVTVTGPKGIRRCENWKEMDFDKQLLANIKKCGFIWPRKVQEAVLPFVVDGYDIQCQSETGTGKTASYLIPLIDNLIKEKQKCDKLLEDSPFCIIIAPTREFAEQIYQETRKLANDTGITVVASYGERYTDVEEFNNCDIVCACVGRLLNLLKKMPNRCQQLRYLVVDEADHFLQGNQKSDFLKILQLLPSFPPLTPTPESTPMQGFQKPYF
uniref:ATP-dependent RNA helicase n=1 Tax=Panagrolaimus superbus TaxID=310955 RepID=A0A914YXR5_9BILA